MQFVQLMLLSMIEMAHANITSRISTYSHIFRLNNQKCLFVNIYVFVCVYVFQAAVGKVLPQDHVQPSPYNAESLNNLNIAGSSSNENRLPASQSTLMHRNIFGSGI